MSKTKTNGMKFQDFFTSNPTKNTTGLLRSADNTGSTILILP
jgi:hypothetical protein